MARDADHASPSGQSSIAGAATGSVTDELAHRLDYYRDLLDTAHAIVWRADALTFQFTFVSAYAEALLGYPLQQWAEPGFWSDHIHPEDREWAVAVCANATKEKKTHELEYRMLAADRRTVWLRDIVRVVTKNDQPVELVGVMIDITEKKQAEQVLQHSEEYLRQVIDTIPQEIWSGPPDGTNDFTNARLRTELGLKLEDFQGDGWQQPLHPEDRDRVLKAWHESVVNGTPFEQQERQRMANGEYHWFLNRGVPLRDESGKILRWFGTKTDITDQKRAEDELRTSEQRWRGVFDNSRIGVALQDMSLRYVEANAAFCEMVGYRLEELRKLTCLDITFQEDRERYKTVISELLNGKLGHFELEKRYIRKNGELVWARLNGSRVDLTDSPLWVVMTENITERKRLEDQVRHDRDRLRLLLDLNRQIVSKLELRGFLEAMFDGLTRLASWEWAMALLPETGSDRLVVYVNRDTEFFPEGTTVPIDSTLAGRVYSSAKPVVFSTQDLPKLSQQFLVSTRMKGAIRSRGLESGCVLPLVYEGRVLGVLFLMTRRCQEAVASELKFLQDLASLAAASLNNSLRFDQVTASQEKLLSERRYIEDQVRREGGFDEIVGASTALRDVLQQVNAVAPTDSSVLVLGESGTGKELIARAIHDRSPRHDHPFIKVDCGAIPGSLMESELFGHEKGAFTGAIAQKMGRIETAHQGTLFLDEVGDLLLELQPKLLRVLQEHAFERVGSNLRRQVDIRVISATNRDLEAMVDKGKFREDLYYRLKVFPIVISPLRDRPADIPPLVKHYVQKYARSMKKEITTIPAAAMEVFMRYPWPGNVRELQHFIERSVILTSGRQLQAPVAELERFGRKRASKSAFSGKTLEEIERESILQTLEESNWVIGGPHGAAAKLGIKRTTLTSRIEKLGLSRP